MVDKDIILAKIAIIQRCLRRIKQTTSLDPNSLDNYDKQDIFVLNLQRAIQATIDIATHLTASGGWGLPETLKENFSLLCENKVIAKELSEKMKKMVGFHNIAVHNYRSIDIEVFKSILTTHLQDIEKYTEAIQNYT